MLGVEVVLLQSPNWLCIIQQPERINFQHALTNFPLSIPKEAQEACVSCEQPCTLQSRQAASNNRY